MAAFSRRRFLEIAGLAAGGVALKTSLWPAEAHAQAGAAPDGLLLVVYFNGGWDQLLALDPRDRTDPRFSGNAPYAAGGTGIHPAYEMISDAGVRAVLEATPSGIQTRGNLTFGPAVTANLMEHASDLAIIRGVDMATLTHEVGRRYFITGKFPRGLAAAGSSATTIVAASHGAARDLPNLSIVCEAYNEGLPAFSSPIQVSSPGEVLNVLRPLGTTLPPASASLLDDYRALQDCGPSVLDATGKAALFTESRAKARLMTQSGAFDLFNFSKSPPAPEVAEVLAALQVAPADINGTKGRAALAGQALAQGFAQAVSLQLVTGIDDHFDWDTLHAQPLREGFDALGNLISFLKSKEHGTSGASVWSKTTLLVFSEFSRTPLLNNRDGRDHHLASSCLIAGPGIRGNQVYGATSDRRMATETVDLATGRPLAVESGGQRIRPADVHATLLHSMGAPVEHLSNQNPQLLAGLLR